MTESGSPVYSKGFSFGASAFEPNNEEDPEFSPPIRAPHRRTTVSGETYNPHGPDNFQPPVHPKNKEDEKLLENLLQSHHLFRHLEDRELKSVVGAMFKSDFKAGSELCVQGTESSANDTFHVIVSGECSVHINGSVTKNLKASDTWGEVDLLYPTPRLATVKANTDVATWALDRQTYTQFLRNTFSKKRALYTEFLSKVSFLSTLSGERMVQLADALQPQKFNQGEYLIKYGEEGMWFYLIVEGTVEVLGRDDKGKVIPVCTFTVGDCVGEMEFLHNHKTVADVVAKTAEVRTAKLNRPHFEMCMGPIKELLKDMRRTDPVFSYYRRKQSLENQDASQILVTSKRQPYNYAGQVKSLFNEGHKKATLTGLGQATETTTSAALKLQSTKVAKIVSIETFISNVGVPGIKITLEKEETSNGTQ